MLAEEIASYTRVIVDDPNQVFLPNSRLASLLRIAYYEFLQKIPMWAREVSYQPAAQSGAYQLALDGVLFGSAATQTRAQRFMRVQTVDATSGRLLSVFTPAPSFETLGQISGTSIGPSQTYSTRWFLDGTTLRFSDPVSGTIQIFYLPDQTINWTTAIVVGANIFVDNFDQFHDVIALLAAKQYYMADGKGNPEVRQNLLDRLADMQEFYSIGQSGDGARYVRDEPW